MVSGSRFWVDLLLFSKGFIAKLNGVYEVMPGSISLMVVGMEGEPIFIYDAVILINRKPNELGMTARLHSTRKGKQQSCS